MNCHEYLEETRNRLPMLFECEQVGEGRLRVTTPFLYPDGDYIDLYLEETPYGLYLTDFGEVLAFLGDQGISIRQSVRRQKILNDILLTHGVEQFRGQLRVRVDTAPRGLAWTVTRLGQAAVQVADLIYTLRPGSLASFRDEVEDFWIETNIEYEAGYSVEGGSSKVYEIDFYLPQKPALVEALSSGSVSYADVLVSKTIRTWHDVQRVDGRYKYLTLLDDSNDVWHEDQLDLLGSISEVVVWSERDRLRDIVLK